MSIARAEIVDNCHPDADCILCGAIIGSIPHIHAVNKHGWMMAFCSEGCAIRNAEQERALDKELAG